MNLFTKISAMVLSCSLSYASIAAPSEQLIQQYNQAASGQTELLARVHQQFEQLLAQDGAEPLTLVYLGSSETLLGAEAFWPWNKMKHTEQGLATIAKGLDLLSTAEEKPELTRLGLPESQLSRAIAATTFTSVPEMFNHFERGYDLYIDLLADELFTEQSFDSRAWIYFYAVKAALRSDDQPRALLWNQLMQQANPVNSYSQQAQALMDDVG